MPTEPFDPEYPLHGLTPTLRRAAEYVHIATQAPLALCATSVLAAASACTHPHIVACWRRGVATPCSQIFVVEAESGERKTAVDALTFREHRAFEGEQARQCTEDQSKFETDVKKWRAIRKGLTRTLEACARHGKDLEAAQTALDQHEARRPTLIQRPRLLTSNTSAEALEDHLAHVYPCVNVVAKDGGDGWNGGLFDRPQMMNSLLDDGTWESRRLSRGTTIIVGASLCFYGPIQGAELERLLGGRARAVFGSGNAYRWLFARPRSTQGTRFDKFLERPKEWMENFSQRTRELLWKLDGAALPLRRKPKRFTKAARNLLAWYGEQIELELVDGKRFALMRGAAAKSPEVCAKIAADMAEFEIYDTVSADVVRGAILIGAWHLNQFKMRFAPYSNEELDDNAMREFLNEKVPTWLRRSKEYWFYNGPDLLNIVPSRLRGDVKRVKNSIRRIQAEDGSVQLSEASVGRGWTIHFPGWHQPDLRVHGRRELPPLNARRWDNPPVVSERTVEQPNSGEILWPGVRLP